ncbi:hypothetical protein [Nonomuraea sp. NPDC049758]|uniref:hypothetical protein n=1 Tax=Nonomuraea sp. NPDC049758 TaxID=3154360 RepID=UPI003419A94B
MSFSITGWSRPATGHPAAVVFEHYGDGHRITSATCGNAEPVLAEVIGDLAFQGRLQHPLGRLLPQATLTGQLQPLTTGRVTSIEISCSSVIERSGGLGHQASVSLDRRIRRWFSTRATLSRLETQWSFQRGTARIRS